MTILDSLSLPLNQPSLIEASAGTGKTYTMANLYLRLILGIECEALTTAQILVVTFTKASTQELRDRIRQKLAETANWFQNPADEEAQNALKDDFMAQVYAKVKANLPQALLRLRVAEREMDLATIFTIDSFCQKMLFQYAFDSGVRFDLNLQTDESELLKTLSEEVWREQFYSADREKTQLVMQMLHSPSAVLAQVKPFLSEKLPPLSTEQQALLASDYNEKLQRYGKLLKDVKQYWNQYRAELIAPIREDLAQKSSSLNKTSYSETYLAKWLAILDAWANSENTHFPLEPFNRFSQSFLNSKTKKNCTPITSSHYAQIDIFIDSYSQFSDLQKQIKTQLVFRYFEALREKQEEYKAQHTEKNFTDMLTTFHHALHGEKGESLAHKIRQQFKFAMIDESQDTNLVQYEIFRKIFIPPQGEHGFILIGDPKQSIYKFRGADIFAYLSASKAVKQTYTLKKNWRSLPDIVQGVNHIFTFNNDTSPFIYPEIAFQAVEYNEKMQARLLKPEQAWTIYLEPNGYKRERFAEQCAEQISLQLQLAERGEHFLEEEREIETENGLQKQCVSRPLVAQDIAILVRTDTEAEAMKSALAKRQIQSVYLSEKGSVYSTQEARDLACVLQACLHPSQAEAILTALSCSLWGLDSAEIYRLKNNENEWEEYVDSFMRYQQIWQHQGILPMLQRLWLEQDILSRLPAENAERRLTNLCHLSELLQAEMEQCENEFALLRRFKQQIENPDGSEEQLLRLESEAKLIKIVTIHKSKGLEYPVVWLPFIAGDRYRGIGHPLLSLYHDEQHELKWDLSQGADQNAIQQKTEAENAEELRLLYVALTRAKYQLNLILPSQFESKWSAIAYLLNNGTIDNPPATAQLISEKGLKANICQLAENIECTPLFSESSGSAQLQAREFTGQIRTTGQITSFSALQAQHQRQFGDELQEDFRQHSGRDDDRQILLPQSFENDEQLHAYSPVFFPRSSKVGTLLHTVFEQWEFNQPLSQEAVIEVCNQLELGEEWHQPLAQWLECIIDTPFTPDQLRLKEIEPNLCLKEWQFYLRLSNEKALPQLNSLLKQAGRWGASLPDLQLNQLAGFVRGFVDLILKFNGKFYIIDYKSNFLGYMPQDYSPDNLMKAMGQQRYDLQYLLYTLALHRYLSSRMGKAYDYERDFGGIAYLFLRGMDGTLDSGVFFDKPSRSLIEEMDRLFA